nr:hypothetical protein [Tanacetum cinerariifolium]
TVILDLEDSTVTYTAVSSPFRALSDIGSLGVDGPPMMPDDLYAYVVAAFQAPPSPDYVPGPEHPPLPEFVPKPVYSEFMPSKDEVFLVEEQLLPAADSPTAESHDTMQTPILRRTSLIILSTDETMTMMMMDHPMMMMMMSIREQPPTLVWLEAEIDRLFAIPSPPPSPLSTWSSPLPQIPLLPLPVSPPLPVSLPLPVSSPPLPASPFYPLRYRAVDRCSGDDHVESGDGGGDGRAKSLSILASNQTSVGGCSLIDILEVTWYTGGGGIESTKVGCSSSSSSSSTSSSSSSDDPSSSSSSSHPSAG